MGLWEQLNSLTLGGSTKASATNVTDQTNPIHIQASNRQGLADTVLINSALMRQEGTAMPDQGKVVQTTGDADRIQFQPNPGECWSFVGGDILATSGTFSVNFEFRDEDGNIALMTQSSSSGQEVIFDQVNMPLPVTFTNKLYLYANLTSGEGRISTAFIRLR